MRSAQGACPLKAASDSINRKIFRAALIVGLFSGLVAIAAMLRELVVARYFGRSDAIDAFLVAYLLPSFVVTVVAGSLATALLPVFVEIRHKEGIEAAQELFSSVLVLNSLTLGLIAGLLGLLAPLYLPYLGSGFPAAKLGLTRDLLLLLLPFIFFNGITSCISSILNASEKFALPSIVPIMTPLVTIVFLVLLEKTWGVYAMAVGVVAGSAIEAALLAKALQIRGMRLAMKWGGFTPAVWSVLRQYTPMLAGSFLIGSTLVVDKFMAAMLSSGSVAALSYANKLISGVFAIAATALSTAIFPYLSKMVALKDWNGCRHTIQRYFALVAVTTVPLTVALMILSRPLITLVFQRGAFTSADAEFVSRVQICYLIQIPFYILSMLFVRFLSAARRNDVLMYGAAISLVLDVILNLIFMKKWGVAGIALSTSCVYAISCVYLIFNSYRVMPKEHVPNLRIAEERTVSP
jgi:putative peptidoglycan lipid II flippase